MIAMQYQTATDSIPPVIPPTTAPYRLGVLSAQLDEICVPELWFVTRHDQREFCRGYQSIVGQTLTTKQFLGSEVQQ